MFIHFYTHDILIFVLNCDKNTLNTNVPYINGIFLPNMFLQFV